MSLPRASYEAWFEEALDAEDPDEALSVLRRMAENGHEINVREAMELVILLSRRQDQRSEGASRRWLVMLSAEDRTLTELQIAAVAVRGLSEIRSVHRCEMVLRALMKWADPTGEQREPRSPT